MKFDRIKDMVKAICTAILVLGCSASYGQMTKGVKFNKLIHDFGSVKEESESVSTVFSFQNISDKPVVIVKVETSCGCTTPEYSRDTIFPGDTGFVRAIYGTRGRPGDFHKNLYVHFNNENYYQSLMISGYVIREANLANTPKNFNTTYANLAFNSTMAEFPNLLNTQKQTYTIKAFNYMGYPIRIYDVQAPDYITVDIGDSLIDVNDSLSFIITVDGSKISQFGELRRRIAILTDDDKSATKFLHVYTNLKEDFSKMSKKEKKNAAAIKMEPSGTIDLGRHSAGEKFSKTIQITNTGKSPLKLRSILPNCSCITYAIGKQELAPGESVSLVLTIDTINQSLAVHNKYITIVTNDPLQSEIRLKIIINITK